MNYWTLFFVIAVVTDAHRVKGPGGQIYEKCEKNVEKGQGKGRTEEAREERDIFDINKGIKSPQLFHGDVLPGKNTRNTVVDTEYQWPSTVIPFEYSSIVSLEAIGSIELARQEYRLRTCLDFVERTTESNYIVFRSMNGCYSSVGMVGGGQTISIGSGCERMATVCHEMMHAIGIWHEQSRADRDDYVKIEWDNITPGYENNFNSYDWDITDARRVPYDYNSIMHYTDTSFSTDGSPTIVTRDSAFQDVIGQRLTFSRGDSTKINRMYKCSDTLLVSYNCNYELESVCGYNQEYENDDIDWFRYVVGEKSQAVSPNAPTVDATADIDGLGSYMLLDTSGKVSGMLGEMKSMRFISKSDVQCLQFSFYLDRDITSTAAMSVHIGYIDQDTGNVTSLSDPLVTLDNDFENKWNVERMTINAPAAYRLVFRAKTGGSSNDVIAIDDVSVQDKPCETSYFVINDYSTILNTYQVNDFFTSPLMTTEDGYNFKIKVYPHGTTSSAAGYMGMYIGLVQGPNDDELAWPFCNKYIRMMIVDQSNNPMYSLNKYSEFLTSQTAGGDLWNKPTSSESAGYYGYRNFMKLTDLTSTHHYLKHDSLMVSVLIKDMNWVNGDVCEGNFTRSVGKQKSTYQEEEIEYDGEMDVDWLDHEDHHDDHEHDEHHEHEDDNDNTVPVGTAVGVALGCAFFVLIVMSGVLCCVNASYKAKLQTVANNITLNSTTQEPPAYTGVGNLTFQTLPEKI